MLSNAKFLFCQFVPITQAAQIAKSVVTPEHQTHYVVSTFIHTICRVGLISYKLKLSIANIQS